MSVLTGCRLPAGSRFAGSRFVKRLVGAVESDSNANPRTREPRTRDQVSASPDCESFQTSLRKHDDSAPCLDSGLVDPAPRRCRQAGRGLPAGRARTPCLTFSRGGRCLKQLMPISGVAGSTSRCDRSAGPCWLAGDHDHRGRALLRVRERRCPTGVSRGKLAGCGLGSECRAARDVARWRGSRDVALEWVRRFWSSGGIGRGHCHRCDHGEPRGTGRCTTPPCSRTPDGTWSGMACSALRRSRSS